MDLTVIIMKPAVLTVKLSLQKKMNRLLCTPPLHPSFSSL